MRRLIPVLLTVPLLAGCGGSSSSSSSSSSAPSTASKSATATGSASAPRATTPAMACRSVPVPAAKGPRHLAAPTARLDPAKAYTVTVSTNCGTFAFMLDARRSPRTAASVAALVRRGFYDGLTFQRVASGFVIQGGDPLGDGTGGPGYQVVEKPPAGTRYVRGVVAMAKTQADPPGASGSQFFVVTGADAGLPPEYAVAGRIVSGLPAVDAIAALPTNPPQDGMPTPPVVMSKVTLSAR